MKDIDKIYKKFTKMLKNYDEQKLEEWLNNDLKLKKMKNKVKISRELFIETIDEIKKQWKHDKKCSKALSVVFSDDFVVAGYNNEFLFYQLVKILKVSMNDDNKDSWIDYFLYDLNFGKRYHDGTATHSDGSFIDLSNAGALYDFLKSELKKNKQK